MRFSISKQVSFSMLMMLISLFLFQCKNDQDTVPIATAEKSLQQEFEEKKLESQLQYNLNDTLRLAFQPQWENVTTNVVDSITISFIPLKLDFLPGYAPEGLKGVMFDKVQKYLIAEQRSGGTNFSLGTYYGDSGNVEKDLSRFSGSLFLKDLLTGGVVRIINYSNGKEVKATSKENNQSAKIALYCMTYEHCTWTRWSQGFVIIDETQGVGQCDWPREHPQSWMQTSTRYEVHCDGSDVFIPSTGYVPHLDVSNNATAGESDAGKFVMAVEDQIKYPKFTNVVKELHDRTKNSPEVMAALRKYTGMTDTQFLDKIKFGNGPKIKIAEMSIDKIGRYNKFESNIIRVSEHWVKQLENNNSLKAQKALNFLLAVTCLHEFVHQARAVNGLPTEYYEYGDKFEEAAFGLQVGHTINSNNAAEYYYYLYEK